MENVSIYALHDPMTGECRYVGQSNKPSLRFSCHRARAVRGDKSHLYSWFRKVRSVYGRDPELVILGELPSRRMANVYEEGIVEAYRTMGVRLTNERSGGLAGSHSEATRRKLSAALKGKRRGPRGPLPLAWKQKMIATKRAMNFHHSEDTRRRISASLSGRTRPGRKLSEEHKRNISISGTGRKMTAEQKERLRAVRTGIRWPQETIQRMRDAQRKRFRERPMSQETCRKLSEAQKRIGNRPPDPTGRKHSPETIEKMQAIAKAAGRRPPLVFGRHPSEETRRKMSLSAKARTDR